MAGPENIYQKQARKHFLDADSPLMNSIYEFNGKIKYDDYAINIYFENGEMLKEYFFDKILGNNSLAEKVLKEYEARRNSIFVELERHELKKDFTLDEMERLYNIHFNYEALIMDKLVSVDKLTNYLNRMTDSQAIANNMRANLFSPSDGRTFFEESLILRLKALGHKLEPEKFQIYNREWYVRRALTKFRLYDVLERFSDEFMDSIYSETEAVKEMYKINSSDDILNRLSSIRLEQFSRRNKINSEYDKIKKLDLIKNNGKLLPFLEFVRLSMQHNEEMRLLRSRTFYMFAQTSLNYKKKPMEFYMECNARRKIRIMDEYKVKH